MKLPVQRCENCRFWDHSPENVDMDGFSFGDCRRYPPKVLHCCSEDYVNYGVTPSTESWRWCGEWTEATIQQMAERFHNADPPR